MIPLRNIKIHIHKDEQKKNAFYEVAAELTFLVWVMEGFHPKTGSLVGRNEINKLVCY